MLTFSISTGLLIAICLLIPLVIKWELNKAITWPAIFIIGLCAGFITAPMTSSGNVPLWATLFIQGAFIGVAALTLLLWRFFRDPERSCTPPDRCVLSAADGKVIYIKRFESGQIPVSEKNNNTFTLEEFTETTLLPASGYLIGTAMTYLDVHVNRAPIAGKIRFLKHIGGLFRSLKHPEAVFQNERATTVIDGADFSVGMIQIASRLVRNIIPFIQSEDEVEQGQRIGKIRFGSQVDLILPDLPGMEILVKPGTQLKAGISIVARY